MEILSTGEKIRRARVYKGITLKELCSDKISISKMSCIENGKIKADEDTLMYISNQLDVEYEYLIEDVYEQILSNVELLKEDLINEKGIEEHIKYNLEYALEYSFNNLAFDLTHRLFNYYVENNKVENVQLLISSYYDLYQKSEVRKNILIYFEDMATFFMKNGEYNEAISYYSRIKLIIESGKIVDEIKYVYACFNEGICYKNNNEIEKAYESLEKVIGKTNYFKNNIDKGKFYHEFSIINILLNKSDVKIYLNKAFKYLNDDKVALAKLRGENGKAYFAINEKEKAIREINEGLEIFPRENSKEYGEFLIRCIETLYKNKEYGKSFDLSDEALNIAIDLDEMQLIEKAYYFKGMIYQKNNQYIQAEMYMNLSTDFLLRFANKEQKYKRYNEMADLYYNLNELKEAIKYFTLAMNIEKKM